MNNFLFYIGVAILSIIALFATSFAISFLVDGNILESIGCFVGAIIAGYADYLLINNKLKSEE